MSLLLLRYLLIEFGRFKKWSVQLEEGIGDFHHLPKIGIVKVDTRWTFLLPHRIKQEREIFLRLFERFTDPKQITPGDIPVKPTFSLGEYFMLCSSHTVSHILHINPYDWVFVLILSLWPFLAYYGSTGLSSDNPDASFPVFWLYEALLLVFSLFLDWKIHNILMSIVPTETIFESNLAASVEDLPDYARDDKTEGGGQSNLELPGFSKLGGLLDREGVSSGRSPRQSNGHGSSQNLDLSKLVEPRKVHGQLGSIPGGDGKSIKCSGSTPTLGADKVCVNSNGGVDHGAGVLSAGDVVVEVIPIGRSASDRDVEWTREEVVGIDAARESKKGCDISKLLKIPVGSYECDAISPASNGPPSNGNGALQAPNGTLQDTPTEVESTIHSAVESAAKKKDAIADSSVPPSGMVTIAELAVVSTEIESGADAAIESSTAVTQNLVSGSYFGFGRNTTEEMSESSRVGDSPSNQRGTSAARRGQSFFAFNWGSVRHMKATSGLWVDDDEAPGARVSFEVPRPGGHDRRTSTMEHRLVPRFIKHHTNLANR